MKQYLLIIIFLVFCADSSIVAQVTTANSVEITSRDTARLNNKIKSLISLDYLTLLNSIVSNNFEDDEIKSIIENHLNGEGKKLFLNPEIIIESDFMPGYDTLKVPDDKKVGDYLFAFTTNYIHTETRSLYFENLGISSLKQSSIGFYFDVTFDCFFKGHNKKSSSDFPRFSRKATIIVKKEGGNWQPYISGISFNRETQEDTSNLFRDIIMIPYNPSEIIDLERNNIDNIINGKVIARDEDLEEAETLFSKKNLMRARQKFLEAKAHDLELIKSGKYDIKLKEIKARIKAVDNALQDSADQVKNVAELRRKAILEFDRYCFEESNRLCTILSDQYAYSDEVIDGLRRKLGNIVGRLNALELVAQRALHSRDKQNMRAYNEEISKITANTGDNMKELMAEGFYRKAIYTLQFDNSEQEEALGYLKKSLEYSNNTHPGAIEEKARLEVEMKKIPEAISDYTTLTISNLVTNQEKAGFFRLLGDLFKSQGDNEKALSNYSEAVNKQNLSGKLNSQPFISKASLEFDMNRMTDCIQTCDSGLKRLSEIAELYFVKGRALNKMNRQIEAGICFKNALKIGLAADQKAIVKQISNTHLLQGNEQLKLKKKTEAIECYDRAVNIDSSRQALFERAGVKLSLNRSDEVIADMNALLNLDPKFKGAHLLKATAFKQKGLLKEAIEESTAELKLDSMDIPSLLLRAFCFKAEEDFKSAAPDFQKTYTAQPSDSIWGYLILSYFRNGDYRKAIMCSEEKYKSVEMNYNSCFYTGRSYFVLGEYKTALQYYKAASKLQPDQPELLWYMGNAYEKAGELDDAFDLYIRLKAEEWKDTASYRVAMVCLQRKNDGDYKLAATKLENYVRMKGNGADCEAVGKLMYVLVKTSEINKAKDYQEKYSGDCINNGLYHYSIAVINAWDRKEGAVIENLMVALQQKAVTPEIVQNEEEFRFMRKDSRFRQLVAD